MKLCYGRHRSPNFTEVVVCMWLEASDYLADLVRLSKIRQCEKDVRPKRKNTEILQQSCHKINFFNNTFSEVKN